MKYLITGISGFVGGHYLEYLFRQHPGAHIVGVDLERMEFNFLEDSFRKKIKFYQGSLLDKNWFSGLIEKSRPDCIINLASYSSVAYSWKKPVECFVNNANIFLNIIDAVRKTKVKSKILSVGSSEEYGIVDKKNIPLTEKSPLNPRSPYAVARVAQEKLSEVYSAGYRIPIISTRSFNHIGPRQKDIFVVSSFARQIVEAKKGRRNKIVCGNLDIVRDFTDVRDIVRAYDLLLQKGKIGEAYNVCSGEGYKLKDILDMLQKKALTNIPVETDESLIRPIDNPVIIGSCEKIQKHTGFERRYNFSETLADILDYWQKHA